MATPAISAVSVRRLMKNEAPRLAEAEPRTEPLAHEVEHRSTGDTAATRPAISA